MGLVIKGLVVEIAGSTILRGISLAADYGSPVGLVGPNGAGKTTTLKTIMGLIRHRDGGITLDGVPLDKMSADQRARLGIGMSPEDRRLFPSLTVRENLLVAATATGAQGAVDEVLEIFYPVKRLLGFRASVLSGGQQKLVALVRAFLVGRKVVLLDEVLEGLSPKARDDLKIMINDFIKLYKRIIILAESNINYITDLTKKIYRIERGEIVEELA